MCQAYVKTGRWADLLIAAKELGTNSLFDGESFDFAVKARIGLKQWKELEQDALVRLKAKADDSKALRAAATATMQAGNREKAAEYIKKLTALPFTGKEEHTLAAWNGLIAGKVEESALTALEKDAEPQGMEPDRYYLMGLVQAALGKTEDAQRSLISGVDVDELSISDAKPWLLLAKLQDQYGLPEAAAASREKAKTRPRKDDASEWALRIR